MREIKNCVVLHGPELTPHHCTSFRWTGDTIAAIELGAPTLALDQPALVVIPGLYNSHTHMGDSCLPDGATGLTLEEGFFRPHGYKYRQLATFSREAHLPHIEAHLRYMAATGTVAHIDFREQGAYGADLLREASHRSGVESVILGQFDCVPFADEALAANTADLPEAARVELEAILAVADGFSESTMNDLTGPAWETIRDLTRGQGKLRAIHCLENAGYRSLSLERTGKGDLLRALELLDPHLVIHLTVANDEEIALLSERRVNAVLNPRANANLGLPLPPVAALLRSQANLLLGTDNGLLNSPNMLAELDFTYKLAKSQFGDALQPEPSAILRMATSNIRPALGGDHYGYLESGLPASFVVVDFTAPHLRHTRHLPASLVTRVTPAEILATFRQGRCLYAARDWKDDAPCSQFDHR